MLYAESVSQIGFFDESKAFIHGAGHRHHLSRSQADAVGAVLTRAVDAFASQAPPDSFTAMRR